LTPGAFLASWGTMDDETRIKTLTGDSQAWLKPENGFAYLVEHDEERLIILRLILANGVRHYKRHRVVTGNEYRVWQQTGNVPLEAEDAGSTPADGTTESS